MNRSIAITTVLAIVLAGCASSQNEPVVRDFRLCHDPFTCMDAVGLAISSNWLQPRSFIRGVSVQLVVELGEVGTVSSVGVEKSSGDAEFDQSALDAVRSASPLVELTGLEASAYTEHFKQFHLVFAPENR